MSKTAKIFIVLVMISVFSVFLFTPRNSESKTGASDEIDNNKNGYASGKIQNFSDQIRVYLVSDKDGSVLQEYDSSYCGVWIDENDEACVGLTTKESFLYKLALKHELKVVIMKYPLKDFLDFQSDITKAVDELGNDMIYYSGIPENLNIIIIEKNPDFSDEEVEAFIKQFNESNLPYIIKEGSIAYLY